MPRIKITVPENFHFTTVIPIRITDINYGGHVGNDSILSLLHEARMQFLQHFSFTELNFAGASLIMSDVGIEFKAESFYGESIHASVAAGEFSRVGFDLFYKLTKKTESKEVIVALAKTGMICYNYDARKVVAVPDKAREVLESSIVNRQS